MTLIDPGLGDRLDRLTILALKLVYGKLAGLDTRHWQKEFNILEEQYGEKLDTLFELFAINAALWQHEDAIRRLREADAYVSLNADLARIGVEISRLNDRRAALITVLNGDRPSDKVPT